jgi:leucyl-tRNA synthetase
MFSHHCCVLTGLSSAFVNAGLREGPPTTLYDRVFENEVNIAVYQAKAAYEKLLFREALKAAGYDLANARDAYRWVF